MKALDTEARRFQNLAFGLVALVSLGWMAGLGIGFAVAASGDASFVHDTPAVLTPGLQGVIALAIVAVVISLLAIIRRISIRADVLADTLPRLLPAAATTTSAKES
jgi:hypothetical protein